MSHFLVIHKVANVPKMDTFGHADPYVRVLNFVETEIFRTQTKKKVSEALFDERTRLLAGTTVIKCVVLDEDLVSDEVIGEAVIHVNGPTSGPVTVAVVGKEAGQCTLTYSILPDNTPPPPPSGQPPSANANVGPLLKNSEMLKNAQLAASASVTFGICWDDRSSSIDVDFVCVAMDSVGLILDVCFFNNMAALNRALVHGGDRRDGAASGIDEAITVNTALLPPHTAALFFCVQCPTGDFSLCSNLTVHVIGGGGVPLASPTPATTYLANGTFAVLGAARCVGPATWSFDVEVSSYGAPCRSFMDAYPILTASLNIDPVMAKELAGAQPKFSLSKGQSISIPVGLSQVTFGLGWDSNCDVDSSCIGLQRDGSLAFRVYFAQQSYNDVVRHSGDNTSGVGAGDDECISVRLGDLPMDVVSLFFTVNVFSSGKSFKDVQGEYCRLLNTSAIAAGTELIRFHSLDSGNYNGVVLVALHRVKHFPQQWRFVAVDLHCEGSTSRELVDECQALQREVAAELP